MPRPRLLDLFCGAGGCSVGYHRAGFDVVGVDINPQPNYPFEFHQADATEYSLGGFDFIHASPPCQEYSVTRNCHTVEYPKLLDPIRDRLVASGLPYVMENVEGAPMLNPVVLCGATLGLCATGSDGAALFLRRHRLFESNRPLHGTPCGCSAQKKAGKICAGVYGGGGRYSKRQGMAGGFVPYVPIRRELMGIGWMTGLELSEAIPPSYTEFIGKQLI